MRVYEVNIDIEPALRGEYLAWLQEHVREILALPGFTGAEILEVEDPQDAHSCRLCVQYRLTGADALERYLHEHAPRLRADGLRRFGDRMRAHRRILRPVPGPSP